MQIFKYELGQEVEDIVTGFKGIVVSRTQYLNKCIRYGVQSTKLKDDGKIKDWEYIDEEQLEPVSEGIIDKIKKKFKNVTQTGGPRPDAPMR